MQAAAAVVHRSCSCSPLPLPFSRAPQRHRCELADAQVFLVQKPAESSCPASSELGTPRAPQEHGTAPHLQRQVDVLHWQVELTSFTRFSVSGPARTQADRSLQLCPRGPATRMQLATPHCQLQGLGHCPCRAIDSSAPRKTPIFIQSSVIPLHESSPAISGKRFSSFHFSATGSSPPYGSYMPLATWLKCHTPTADGCLFMVGNVKKHTNGN